MTEKERRIKVDVDDTPGCALMIIALSFVCLSWRCCDFMDRVETKYDLKPKEKVEEKE